MQNYPNPFNSGTTIGFVLSRYERVSLAVYDILGRQVARIVEREMEPGRHLLSWDGHDTNGGAVSSGVYFCRVTTGHGTTSRKMVLLR
ncbi:MAG: T9SS type A sorting domain-containing protein [Candidatus Zixiibacteriota bacterium]